MVWLVTPYANVYPLTVRRIIIIFQTSFPNAAQTRDDQPGRPQLTVYGPETALGRAFRAQSNGR
jgi:hypothetical protein